MPPAPEPRLRAADALAVDRLLNRGLAPADAARAASAALDAPVPLAAVLARARERAAQGALAARLPPGVEQRTPEWYAARALAITASDFYPAAFGSDAARRAFVLRKSGAGGAAPFVGSDATRWGVKYEPLARRLYELYHACTVKEHGLLLHPAEPAVGASPDGVNEHGVCWEAKCPYSRTLAEAPPEYVAQMQGQMEVCGLDACDFTVCRVREHADAPAFWAAFDAAHAAGYGAERFGAAAGSDFSAPGAAPDAVRAFVERGRAAAAAVTLHEVHDFRVTRVERDREYAGRMVAALKERWLEVLDARRRPPPAAAPAAAAGFGVPQLRGFAFKQFGDA